MTQQKPDLNKIFAVNAPSNNIANPDDKSPGKFEAGWVAQIPPFEWFNYIQNLFSTALAHINENGLCVWDNQTEYNIGSLVKGFDGVIYQSTAVQSGNDPVGDSTGNWVNFVTANVPTVQDATESQKGIARFSTNDEAAAGTNTNSTITPKNLKDYVDNNVPAVQDATTSVKGISRFSTNDEAAAGNNTDTTITPKNLKDYVDANSNTSDFWTTSRDYIVGEEVVANDNKYYRCRLASGPDSGGPVNPTDNAPNSYWLRIGLTNVWSGSKIFTDQANFLAESLVSGVYSLSEFDKLQFTVLVKRTNAPKLTSITDVDLRAAGATNLDLYEIASKTINTNEVDCISLIMRTLSDPGSVTLTCQGDNTSDVDSTFELIRIDGVLC